MLDCTQGDCARSALFKVIASENLDIVLFNTSVTFVWRLVGWWDFFMCDELYIAKVPEHISNERGYMNSHAGVFLQTFIKFCRI